MTIVDLKKDYLKQLNIIKDENNGKSVRSAAHDKLILIHIEILKEEPKCNIDTPEVIKAKFIDKLNEPDVIWYSNELCSPTETKELCSLEVIRRMAYIWVKMNHPKLNDQTDKFGQIVNARMQLIIAYRQ